MHTEHAAEDKQKKESVEARNSADSLVFQTKKQIDELKDKISADEKARLETEIKKLRMQLLLIIQIRLKVLPIV
jgi:molecular chaperone DnaK